MRWTFRKGFIWAVGLALCLAGPACDFSNQDSADGGTDGGVTPGPGPGPGTGNLITPIFYGIDGGTEFCVGSSVSLLGVNFSSNLDGNVVNFISGVVRVPGIPLRVEFPTDGNARNGLESRLRVLVPGGVSTGQVELYVNGVYAGASGYDACPQLFAYTIGRNTLGRYVVHQGVLGFSQTESYIRLYGLNFKEITAVTVEDSQGSSVNIESGTIERNPLPVGGVNTNQVVTGYSSIGFSLHDDNNDVNLSIDPNRRDNIKVRVVGASGMESNSLEIPVYSNTIPLANPLGAAINAVKVPTGVRAGPVRIYYTMYDLEDEVATPHKINVSWTVDGGKTWYPALYDATDPDATGETGVLPGTIFHTSRYRLFPGGGALRLFTWDAQNDPNFVGINQPQSNQEIPPRNWTISFRITPVPEGGAKPINHRVETPQILYYYLEDRPGDVVADERTAELVEGFLTDLREDTKLTTASYGPPNNEEALVGTIPSGSIPQFGEGTADLQLRNVDQEDLPEGFVSQYYEINTDDMDIVYHLVTQGEDAATPDDDIDAVSRLDFPNPGEELSEFHLGRLLVCQDVLVVGRGLKPIIIRLSGDVDTSGDEDDGVCPFQPQTIFAMAAGSVLDLNGADGENGPREGQLSNLWGRGGIGGPGGGAGGDGASLSQDFGKITEILHAEDGENHGGGGGETTGGLLEVPPGTTASKFSGGPGGGGGHRVAGGRGDSGTSTISKFRVAAPGAGGVSRGDAKQFLLTGGSGGGGGGATIGTETTQSAIGVTAGSGGGGGGGAIRVVANGRIYVDPTATIQANGGDGGSYKSPAVPPNPAPATAYAPSGPGGGGSGGTIVLQARLTVDVQCSSLLVNGGTHGTGSTQQNKLPGSGDGAPGWIRLESATGGTPTCTCSFQAATTLSKNLKKDDVRMEVASTDGFPDRGVIFVDSEEIRYGSISSKSFDDLVRPAGAVAHSSGAAVVGGVLYPYDDPTVWSQGSIVSSPDTIDVGSGRDGELHLRFEPGLDAATGEPYKDPTTGVVTAVWHFDTSEGLIMDANGEVFLETISADTDPGLLDVSRLVIDANTVLKCTGTHAARILVSGQADIAGTIDVSGLPGGMLRFRSDNLADPLPGLGGAGGAGGGNGGDGGSVDFVNGNLDDKSPGNVAPVNGAPGSPIPRLPAALDKTPVPYGNGDPQDQIVTFPSMTRALPGASLPAQGCGGAGEPICDSSAGGGGGGGNLKAGKAGQGIPLPDKVGGKGGSIFGTDGFRWGGDFWTWGGSGGGGGGACPHVSGDYEIGIPGQYLFKNDARYAPGTGGGGGGGALLLIASNLYLRGTGQILARGGDAYQSIDLGGNGGGGAGGNIFIQVKNALTVESGALIDVRGGRANMPIVAKVEGTYPAYPGNVRMSGANSVSYGGDGGDGAVGRLRIEAAIGSMVQTTGINRSVTAGPLLLDTAPSIAYSKAIRIGVGPGSVSSTHVLEVGAPVVRFFEFGQPSGTDSTVLWEGARESLDLHGSNDTLLQQIRDPDALRYNEFLRFSVPFLSNKTTLETQSVSEIRLSYSLKAAGE